MNTTMMIIFGAIFFGCNTMICSLSATLGILPGNKWLRYILLIPPIGVLAYMVMAVGSVIYWGLKYFWEMLTEVIRYEKKN